MLLLQISNSPMSHKLIKLNYLKSLKKRFKVQLKNLRTQKTVRLISSDESFCIRKSLKPINYVIGVVISKTNIIVYLTDIKGELKFFHTAGSLKLKKSQKKKKVIVLTKLLKVLLMNVNFITKNDVIALHLQNFNEGLVKLLYHFLVKHYNLEIVQVNNNQPHNGCRPRKLKRKKRRKLNFIKN